MSTYGSYRTTDKKCATCSFWSGSREIKFQANKPYYVHAAAGGHDCIAQKGRKSTGNTSCLKWKLWEKIG